MIGRDTRSRKYQSKIPHIMAQKKNTKPQRLLSQTAYAEKRKVSRQYISKLVKEGVLPLKNGKIDPIQADAILEARREPARQTQQQKTDQQAVQTAAQNIPAPTRSVSDTELPTLLLKTRIKSESEKAKLLEIKAKVEAGKYVDVDEVRASAFKQARIVRENILILADRLAPVLASISDPAKIHKILQEEHTKALEELSKKPLT